MCMCLFLGYFVPFLCVSVFMPMPIAKLSSWKFSWLGKYFQNSLFPQKEFGRCEGRRSLGTDSK